MQRFHTGKSRAVQHEARGFNELPVPPLADRQGSPTSHVGAAGGEEGDELGLEGERALPDLEEYWSSRAEPRMRVQPM